MRDLAPGTDRYGAGVVADRRGEWTFHIEAWSDPISTWYHDAASRSPAGKDVELVFAEGARCWSARPRPFTGCGRTRATPSPAAAAGRLRAQLRDADAALSAIVLAAGARRAACTRRSPRARCATS